MQDVERRPFFTARKYKNPLEYNFMCLAERGLGQQRIFGTRFSK